MARTRNGPRTPIPFVAFDREYAEVQQEVLEAIDRCGQAGSLILGEEVERFEEEVARRANQAWAVAVGSGYDALYLGLRAIREQIGRCGGVGLPAYRHVSADNAVINAGFVPYKLPHIAATIVEPPTINVLMPVHMEGVVGPPLQTDLPVIEDACQAFGALGLGQATLTCFSFHPMKVLGAMGDGGAIAGKDPKLRDRLRTLRHHGERGVNSRLDAIQAAILNVKLRHLDWWLERRAQLATQYTVAFQSIAATVSLPRHASGRVWSSYVIRTPRATETADALKTHEIEASVFDATRLALPIYPQLTDDEQQRVIEAVVEFFKGWCSSRVFFKERV